MGEQGRAMNRMGWAIALAGAWVLAALAVVGATNPGGSQTPDCMPGYYLNAGWCVRDPQPADAPNPSSAVALVANMSGGSAAASVGASVGPVGIEPTTEGL